MRDGLTRSVQKLGAIEISMSLPEFIYTVILRPKPLKSGANWLIRRMLPERLRYDGVTLAVNPRDPVVSGALLFGSMKKLNCAPIGNS